MKHTQGKWKIENLNSSQFFPSVHCEGFGNGPLICNSSSIGSENRANAKLISKSPEMYKELKMLYPFLKDHLNNFEGITRDCLKLKLERIEELLKEIES